MIGLRSQVTATQVANENEVGKCALQRVVQGLEDAIDRGLQIMADWIGLPEGGHVTLYNDFGVDNLSDASAQLVITMQQGGLITKETAIREQQRRGMLSADIEPTDELAAVSGEGPALGMMGLESMAGTGVSADTVPVGAPAGPVASAEPRVDAPTQDLTPIVEAIRLLAESFKPVDLTPLLDALRNQAETTTIEIDVTPIATAVADAIRSIPAVNIPAQPAHTFNIDATTTVSPAGAPVVNMPAITVNTPDINIAPAAVTVNTPDVNVAAPSITVTTPDVTVNQAPITITTPDIAVAAPTINVSAPAASVAPEADKPRTIAFQTNAAGEITGASMT